jgi:hypothetical protein
MGRNEKRNSKKDIDKDPTEFLNDMKNSQYQTTTEKASDLNLVKGTYQISSQSINRE